MKSLIVSAAMAIGLAASGTAVAADAIDAIPVPSESPLPVTTLPVEMWAGAYGGVYGQYSDGRFDTNAGDIDANGFDGGVFVGFNRQIGTVVYGLEGDVGMSGVDGAVPVPAPGFVAEKGFNGSLRARAGVAFDPVLIYGTAGIAATQAEVSDGTNTDSNTHLGWTAGVGADALVTDNVFGRLEYRYSDYESKIFNVGGTAVSSGFDEHSIRAGLGLKF